MKQLQLIQEYGEENEMATNVYRIKYWIEAYIKEVFF